MSPILFFSFLIYTLITIVGINSSAPYNIVPVLFVFVGIPLIDVLIGTNRSNPRPDQETKWKRAIVWGPAVYLYALTHFAVLIFGAYHVFLNDSWPTIVLHSLVVGLYTGGLGITVAHELCHKKELLPRLIADMLLATVWYNHFSVEHVRGHHLAVATPDDPASARKDENVYFFLWRTITGSFMHALKLDSSRVLLGIMASTLLSLIAAYFGLKVFAFFLTQALVAIILLEMVNYVEHYGLTRKKLDNGRYEKVLPIHSWNSAHLFSNGLLFNLQRHSDHHAMANLPYTVLKHREEAPQLPSGYPGMILIALIPALWFKFMNPKVLEWEKSIN